MFCHFHVMGRIMPNSGPINREYRKKDACSFFCSTNALSISYMLTIIRCLATFIVLRVMVKEFNHMLRISVDSAR